MPEPRHLRSAPITEAIIDFRVKARPGLQAEEFSALKGRMANLFPKVDERRDFRAEFQAGPEGPRASAHDLGLQGYFYRSDDEKNIAQFRVDGFTFNRLKPYTSWESLFPFAMDLWRTYCDFARPEVVVRIALRYINHVPLPPSLVDFDDYLRAGPVIPPELPQHLSGFLTRITIHDIERDLAANVSQALETNVATQKMTVILDIDAYRQHEYATDDPAIEETFQELHAFKNRIFFNALTDQTLRQFE